MATPLTVRMNAVVSEADHSNLSYAMASEFQQDCLYAYTQEFRLDDPEAPEIIKINDQPDYNDAVFIRFDMLDAYDETGTSVYVKVYSSSGSYITNYITLHVPFYDVCGNAWWTDDSSSSPDTITKIEIGMTQAGQSATIRVTAYFNAS